MRMAKRRNSRRAGFEKCLIPWKELTRKKEFFNKNAFSDEKHFFLKNYIILNEYHTCKIKIIAVYRMNYDSYKSSP